MTLRTCRALLALAVLAAACSGGGADGDTVLLPSNTSASTSTTEGTRSYAGTTPAPEFPDGMEWLNVERPLSLAELRGKLVLLDFWTYGCVNCIHIIPDLERLEAEYADELVVIGVHSAKFTNEADTENIRDVIARYGLTHPVVNDADFAVWNQWGANAWPTVVLIDPAGNIVGGHSGEGIYPIFQPVIDALVEEFDARIDRSPLALAVEQAPNTVLSFPGKVLADAEGGRLFVADTNHHRIVVADLATGEVTAVIGSGSRGFTDGASEEAAFDQPQGMALGDGGSTLFVADLGNHAIRTIDLGDGTVATIAGNGRQASTYPPRPGIAPDVELSSPWDLLLDGDLLYIAMAGSHQIWSLDLAGARFQPVAGSGAEGVAGGPALEAALAQPSGLAIDASGRVYFADSESSSIRWVDPGGDVGLLAGSDQNLFDFGLVDGVGSDSRFQHPLGVVTDGGTLFVADTYNSVIRRIDLATGAVTTLAGGDQGWADGASPRFSEPGGIDLAGGHLYVADTNNHVIRRVDPASGATETIVLYGIERFAREDAGGEAIVLDAVRVAPGAAVLSLGVALPAGYVLNDIAPFTVELSAGDGVAGFPAGAVVSDVEPTLPMQIPIEVSGEAGSIRLDLTIYYCTSDADKLCLVEQAALEVPITPEAGGASVIDVAYRVEG